MFLFHQKMDQIADLPTIRRSHIKTPETCTIRSPGYSISQPQSEDNLSDLFFRIESSPSVLGNLYYTRK